MSWLILRLQTLALSLWDIPEQFILLTVLSRGSSQIWKTIWNPIILELCVQMNTVQSDRKMQRKASLFLLGEVHQPPLLTKASDWLFTSFLSGHVLDKRQEHRLSPLQQHLDLGSPSSPSTRLPATGCLPQPTGASISQPQSSKILSALKQELVQCFHKSVSNANNMTHIITLIQGQTTGTLLIQALTEIVYKHKTSKRYFVWARGFKRQSQSIQKRRLTEGEALKKVTIAKVAMTTPIVKFPSKN